MKKLCSLIFVAFGAFFCFFSNVDALFIDYKTSFNTNGINVNFMEGDEIDATSCNGLFTEDALDLISEILGYFKIIAPILLILLTAVDLGGAVLSQDNDSVKKATGKIIKRAIATVALFFVPTIVQVVLDLPGVRSTIQIPSDPLCGTMDSYVSENDILIK